MRKALSLERNFSVYSVTVQLHEGSQRWHNMVPHRQPNLQYTFATFHATGL